MADDPGASVYDTVLADLAALRIRKGVEYVLTRELRHLGLEPVFEDSFATYALRVASARQTGTAYLELRQDDARMRIVLSLYVPPPLPKTR
jgi:hypothetical protein